MSQRVSVSPSINWQEVAAATEGFSGADLQALVYNAHLDVIHTSIHVSSDKKEIDVVVDDDPIEFKAIGGASSSQTRSRAEQSALEKRVTLPDEKSMSLPEFLVTATTNKARVASKAEGISCRYVPG